jgi:hypothetical protein
MRGLGKVAIYEEALKGGFYNPTIIAQIPTPKYNGLL